jgi:predicted nuclease of predicted toxin-antitoxin system
VILLLDEMYPAWLAAELQARGHDVVSLHDPAYRALEGAPDAEVFQAAVSTRRALVTENVSDFRRLDSAALARGEPTPVLILTSNRQFPRGAPATLGRLLAALHALLLDVPPPTGSVFLKASPPPPVDDVWPAGS